MSEATWAVFGGGVKVDDSTFDEKVGGSKFLEEGVHKDCIIASVEPKVSKAGNSMVVVQYEDSNGAGIRQFVLLEGKPDENGDARFHWVYKQLGSAVCNDPTVRLKFFGETLPNNPALFKGLVGLKVTVKVKNGPEGFKVMDVSTGGKALIDVETGEAFPDTEVYADFTEANEKAAELGLQRCWCEIDRVSVASPEEADKNVAVLNELMEEGLPAPTPIKKAPVSI